MKKISGIYKFYIVVLTIYLFVGIFDFEIIKESLINFKDTFIKILETLVFVLIIMTFTNLILDSDKTNNILEKSSGLKSRFFAALGGIIIGGPPYILYPMLRDFKTKGVNNSLIAVFLYNRNVKIPFIPITIIYFGVIFTIIFYLYILIFSIFNGIILGKILKD